MGIFDQPVCTGDVLEVKVVDRGKNGDPVAYVDGLAVFVADTEPGEEVKIRIERVEHNCAVAEKWDQ